jgi:hypothetical protein
MRIHHIILAAAAVLASAASADAKPRRVVILEFDGPRTLADSGRAAVVQVLNDSYDVVSTKRWEAAKMAAVGRGPMQWSTAAKAAGVDAVVDGWVDREGMRTHLMTIAVSDAMTGRQIDTLSVKITDTGVVSDEAHKKLTSGLDELLNWVDSEGSEATTKSQLPNILDQGPTLGSHQPKPEKPAVNCDEGDDDDDSDCGDDNGEEDAPRHHRPHSHGKHKKHKKHHRRDDGDDDDDDHADNTKKVEAKSIDNGEKTTVAATDSATASATVTAGDVSTQGARDLENVFGVDSVEYRAMTGKNPLEKPHPSPHVEISLGGFAAERGMSFQQDPPDFPATPPSYPATGLDGLAVRGAVYPFPVNKNGWDLTGIGFEFTLEQSLGASLGANDTVNDTYGQYSMNYTAYEGGIHYRYPLGSLVTLEGSVNYGRSSYTLESDFPSSVQIPDVSYQYLSLGGDVELNVTERMRIDFGGRWLYLLDTGDVSSEDWYGSGAAGGLQLHIGFKVPLGDLLFIRGQVEYMRVSMDFNGDGNLSTSEDDDSLAVSNITDSSIGGSVQLGVAF